jgi:aspartate carbamoyltransferase catalytic subunit
MLSKSSPTTRHVVSINDLSDSEVEKVFSLAQSYLKELPDPKFDFRIGSNTKIATKSILASLFYEPSTRTRLSFESAMLRLGGGIITSSDPATSSAAKGESLADSVRVISNYADLIVIRHPKDGAARLAAEYSTVPIINGGDGSHEHPTQTLCDIFTLKRKNKNLKNLNVAIAGDLKGSRTIHSFVYALARFGAHIVPMPAPGMELPAHVDKRLREEFHCAFDPGHSSIGALYRTPTPDHSHEPTLFSQADFELSIRVSPAAESGKDAKAKQKIGAVYVTRFQKERWTEKERDYPKINAKFLGEAKYSRASVLHPLPRVGELDPDFDRDARAVYFEQAAYGVPIRMALISLLLGTHEEKSFEKFQGGFRPHHTPIYDQPLDIGIRCSNKNCISHDTMERPYVRNKFYVVKGSSLAECTLRCVYCETDIEEFVVAHKKNRWFTDDSTALAKAGDLREIIVFEQASQAEALGYHSRRHALGQRPSGGPKNRYGT